MQRLLTIGFGVALGALYMIFGERTPGVLAILVIFLHFSNKHLMKTNISRNISYIIANEITYKAKIRDGICDIMEIKTDATSRIGMDDYVTAVFSDYIKDLSATFFRWKRNVDPKAPLLKFTKKKYKKIPDNYFFITMYWYVENSPIRPNKIYDAELYEDMLKIYIQEEVNKRFQ